MDVLEEVGEAVVPARSTVDDSPVAASLSELAELLTAAERPGLLVGNELVWADGLDAAADLAETLGAPVHGQDPPPPASRRPEASASPGYGPADGRPD
jgi:thiamine pyrophosphate-dependent acetolactate synthase large subunit-like protein